MLAVIYHSTSSTAIENSELYKHIQSNVDHFLSKHPDSLIIITGDFNPTSTGFNANRIKQLTGLRQVINVPTRENSILDWCLTNMSDLNFEIIQLPPVGASDHNSILIKEHLHRANMPCNERVWKRDMRDSKVRVTAESSNLIESIQRRALRIIHPSSSYEDALVCTGLETLSERRHNCCLKFIEKTRSDVYPGYNPLVNILRQNNNYACEHVLTIILEHREHLIEALHVVSVQSN